MHWHATLVGFGMRGTDDDDPADADLALIPGIMEKVILPKLART